MPEKPVRHDVSLPSDLNRNAQENEKGRFLDLADRLTGTSDPNEQQRLKEELSRLTFGE
jgi:hypothetical protein